MKLSSFRYAGPQALKSMASNGWMTVAAILTITISLFLCAVFWLLLINIDANMTKVEEDIRIVVYLDFDIDRPLEREALEKDLSWIPGVEEITFIPKEDGLSTLEGRFANMDLMDTLGGTNPLPDAYSITAASADVVADIAAACAELDGVLDVRYGEGTVEKLFALTDILRQGGLLVMGLLAIAAVVLIAMVTRLAIVSRKKEIMIMKWVGATNAFIRWPFFLEGLLLGLLGAILAAGLAILLYSNLAGNVAVISFVQILPLSQVWPQITLFTLGAGLLLGAIGSFLPLTKFLDV